jgi:hypothetical protein
MDAPARQMLFHGCIVMLVGLFAGMPYGRAITRRKSEDIIRGWRVAHASLCLGATTMFAVAAILTPLHPDMTLAWVIAIAYILCGYGFSFALTLAPILGHRGLTADGPMKNQIVFTGNCVGVIGALVGTLALAYAAAKSL